MSKRYYIFTISLVSAFLIIMFSQNSKAQDEGCVTVTVHPYQMPGNWWPVAWLTPCHFNTELSVPFSSSQDTSIKIKPGSHFRIGQSGSTDSFVDLKEQDTRKDFRVSCTGRLDCEYGCARCWLDKGKPKTGKNIINKIKH